MGCRHSSATTESPVKIRPNEGPVVLTSKISLQRAEQIDYRIYDGLKSITSKSSVSLKKVSSLRFAPSSSCRDLQRTLVSTIVDTIGRQSTAADRLNTRTNARWSRK